MLIPFPSFPILFPPLFPMYEEFTMYLVRNIYASLTVGLALEITCVCVMCCVAAV